MKNRQIKGGRNQVARKKNYQIHSQTGIHWILFGMNRH